MGQLLAILRPRGHAERVDHDETHHESSTETVSLGGAVGGGRLNALVTRIGARQQSIMIVGSTVLLGLVVLGAIMLAGNDPDEPDPPAEPSSSPLMSPAPTMPDTSRSAAPHGRRVWVGYHDLMISVPRSWAHSDTVSCGTTPDTAAAYPRSPHSKCSATTPAERSTVTWLTQQLKTSSLLDNGFYGRTINQRQVLTTSLKKAGHVYVQYVAVPARDVLVVIGSPDRSTVERLVETVRGVPAQWVIVPDLRGRDPRGALTALADAGLVGRADHNSGVVMPAETVVVNQNPPGGQVVEGRTRVTIAVLPDESPN
jgi:hypothetical protein